MERNQTHTHTHMNAHMKNKIGEFITSNKYVERFHIYITITFVIIRRLFAL